MYASFRRLLDVKLYCCAAAALTVPLFSPQNRMPAAHRGSMPRMKLLLLLLAAAVASAAASEQVPGVEAAAAVASAASAVEPAYAEQCTSLGSGCEMCTMLRLVKGRYLLSAEPQTAEAAADSPSTPVVKTAAEASLPALEIDAALASLEISTGDSQGTEGADATVMQAGGGRGFSFGGGARRRGIGNVGPAPVNSAQKRPSASQDQNPPTGQAPDATGSGSSSGGGGSSGGTGGDWGSGTYGGSSGSSSGGYHHSSSGGSTSSGGGSSSGGHWYGNPDYNNHNQSPAEYGDGQYVDYHYYGGGGHQQPGYYSHEHEAWTCTGCNMERNYQLRLMADGSSRCGEWV